VDSLLSRAGVLYAERALDGVREAAKTWFQAARADSSRIEGLIGAARAEIWLVDHEPEAAAREAAAVLGVQAAQWCLRIAPQNPECSYYMGAALGVQARERQTTALDALPRIEQAFLKAAETDPGLDDAGPDRALALLYLRAPGWPTGPGDPDRGLEHARKAVELRPEYPPNLLALAEALGATGDKEAARQHYSQALQLARSREAAGDPDAAEWIREADAALAAGSSGR
jgi:tetratricopeptide (TPR) repeat protein